MSNETAAAKNAIKVMEAFINPLQMKFIVELMTGEEGQFFIDKINELAAVVATMPKTYETDGQGESAIAYLHYFKHGADWYITERDIETAKAPGQHQAFGWADIGYGGELGYISIVELLQNRVELDLHFTPRPVGEVKRELLTA